jgi:hypothetical protein
VIDFTQAIKQAHPRVMNVCQWTESNITESAVLPTTNIDLGLLVNMGL